jgi:hypothetical protein
MTVKNPNELVKNPNELRPVDVAAIEKETKSFTCPNCHVHLQFLLRVHVVGVHETLTGDEHRAIQANAPMPKEKPKILIVEQAKETGVFQKFTGTVKIAQPYNIPADLERYFLTWLTRATKVKTPQFAIRPCLDAAEREGRLELWVFQSTAAVVKNDYLHSFLPYQFVQGKELSTTLVSNGQGIQAKNSTLTLPIWVKTRNGYVAGKGMLFQELKGKAAGSFANTGT